MHKNEAGDIQVDTYQELLPFWRPARTIFLTDVPVRIFSKHSIIFRSTLINVWFILISKELIYPCILTHFSDSFLWSDAMWFQKKKKITSSWAPFHSSIPKLSPMNNEWALLAADFEHEEYIVMIGFSWLFYPLCYIHIIFKGFKFLWIIEVLAVHKEIKHTRLLFSSLFYYFTAHISFYPE